MGRHGEIPHAPRIRRLLRAAAKATEKAAEESDKAAAAGGPESAFDHDACGLREAAVALREAATGLFEADLVEAGQRLVRIRWCDDAKAEALYGKASAAFGEAMDLFWYPRGHEKNC